MGGTTNFPLGFQNGITLRGISVEIPIAGQAFWVDSTSNTVKGGVGSSNGNPGTYQKPFATLDFAVGKCKPNRGDVIYLKPGHVETITVVDSVNLDVAGITVIGLGKGTLQARMDFTNLNGTVGVNVSNISLVNLNFHANVSGVKEGLSLEPGSTDCLIKECLFDVENNGTDEFEDAIDIENDCDRTIIEDNIIDMGLGGSRDAICLVRSNLAGCTIRRNRIVGNYSTANIDNALDPVTEIYIEDNLLINGTTNNLNPQPVINMLSGTTGVIRNNTFVCDVSTFALQTIANTMSFINNQRTDDVGEAKTSTDISASVAVSTDG